MQVRLTFSRDAKRSNLVVSVTSDKRRTLFSFQQPPLAIPTVSEPRPHSPQSMSVVGSGISQPKKSQPTAHTNHPCTSGKRARAARTVPGAPNQPARPEGVRPQHGIESDADSCQPCCSVTILPHPPPRLPLAGGISIQRRACWRFCCRLHSLRTVRHARNIYSCVSCCRSGRGGGVITVPLWWDGTNPSIVCPLSDTSFVVAHRQTLPSAGFLPSHHALHNVARKTCRNGLQPVCMSICLNQQ